MYYGKAQTTFYIYLGHCDFNSSLKVSHFHVHFNLQMELVAKYLILISTMTYLKEMFKMPKSVVITTWDSQWFSSLHSFTHSNGLCIHSKGPSVSPRCAPLYSAVALQWSSKEDPCPPAVPIPRKSYKDKTQSNWGEDGRTDVLQIGSGQGGLLWQGNICKNLSKVR